MKLIARLLTAAALAAVFYSPQAKAQSWCTFVAEPYGSSMPGITNVTLNSINRNSAALESQTNSFVNTGLSTTLVPGQTYTISITHTIDASICPDMNLRVWIDYNQDYDFGDKNELAVTTDHHAPGTYSAMFTVPADAKIGITRMRVTAKMSNLGGHSTPTPCNDPPDPIGYHGEVEDYTINMSATGSGIEANAPALLQSLSSYPNPFSAAANLDYTLADAAQVRLEVYNLLGEKVATLADEFQVSGEHHYEFIPSEGLPAGGIYFIRLSAGNSVLTERIMQTQ
jgi:hypothetical protein